MSNRGRMVIIGAGINGLVAANLAQRSGWQVTLLERSDRVGGACVSGIRKLEDVHIPL